MLHRPPSTPSGPWLRAAIVGDYHAAMNDNKDRRCIQCNGVGVIAWEQQSVPPQPPAAGVPSGRMKCPLCDGTGIVPPDAGDILRQPPSK